VNPAEREALKRAVDQRRREICGLALPGAARRRCAAPLTYGSDYCKRRALPGRLYCGLHLHRHVRQSA